MTKDYAKSRSRLTQKRHHRYHSNTAYSAGLPSWAWMLIGLIFGIAFSTFMYWKLHKSNSLSTVQTNTNSALHAKQSEGSLVKSNKLGSQSKSKKSKTQDVNSAKAETLTPSIPPSSGQTHANTAPYSESKVSDLKDLRNLSDTQKQNNQNNAAAESRFDFYTLLPTTSTEAAHHESNHAHKQSATPYILQAGSFKTHQQAERLKATLALQGLEAHIQTVTINAAESWYRVYIGPFTTKAQALEAQQHLENGLESGIPPTLNSVILKMRV